MYTKIIIHKKVFTLSKYLFTTLPLPIDTIGLVLYNVYYTRGIITTPSPSPPPPPAPC